MWAAINGHTEMVAALLKAGADVDVETQEGMTALTLAANFGYAEVAKALLTAGVDVNTAVQNAWTPLMYAAKAGHADLVKLLLDAGADVGARNKNGNTSWDLAEEPAVIRLLEEAEKKKSEPAPR